MVARIRANTQQGCGCCSGGFSHGISSCCGSVIRQPYVDDPSVDKCGRRKRLRVNVCKPTCITVFGLDDQRLLVDQLFGQPNCWARKPIKENGTRVFLDNDNCQITLIKPGTYELNMEDYGLFPEDFQFFKSCLSLEEAHVTAEVGNVVVR